jgi:hypothetical protein
MPTPSNAEVKNKWQRYASIRPMRLHGVIYLMSLTEQALLPRVVTLTNIITTVETSLITWGGIQRGHWEL